jgi:hypothetical protein
MVYGIWYLGKSLGFELGAPPHVQIREIFEGTIWLAMTDEQKS